MAEQDLAPPRPLVLGYWLAGSFISDEIDPNDIDVTVLVDHEILGASAGRPGSGALKKLFANRRAISNRIHVEPFLLRVRPEASTLFPNRLPAASQLRLAERGGLDNFWQRMRHEGASAGPVEQHTTLAERGYVEVAA